MFCLKIYVSASTMTFCLYVRVHVFRMLTMVSPSSLKYDLGSTEITRCVNPHMFSCVRCPIIFAIIAHSRCYRCIEHMSASAKCSFDFPGDPIMFTKSCDLDPTFLIEIRRIPLNLSIMFVNPILRVSHNTTLSRYHPWTRDQMSIFFPRCLNTMLPKLTRRHHTPNKVSRVGESIDEKHGNLS